MNEQERLLTVFCRGVRHPQVSGFEVLELLDIRSTLARWEGELSEEQRKKLEEADGVFLKNAGQFYENVAQVANLEEMRKRAIVPPSHWWWYLEKLGPAERAAL
jgi:glutathione synthase/RimK-type ligase-like ATP-grasp enzyme